MNKLAFVLFCIFILFSCAPSVKKSYTFTKRIVNKTEAIIINEITTKSVGNYSVSVNPSKSGEMTMSIAIKTKPELFGLAHTRVPQLMIKKDIIYNLRDTTSYIFLRNDEKEDTYSAGIYKYCNLKYIPLSATDSIYASCLSKGESIGINNNNPHLFVTLTVNEKLLSIMEKDYTMLEKFKDYYR